MKERTFRDIKEWMTESGLNALIRKCEWAPEVKTIAPSLHDFFTGYIQVEDTSRFSEEDINSLDVHGGVTFHGELREIDGKQWIGFDMAHAFDEENQDLNYVIKECEKLATQIKKLTHI
jgi:protein involved in sex pheromone biosynthesis